MTPSTNGKSSYENVAIGAVNSEQIRLTDSFVGAASSNRLEVNDTFICAAAANKAHIKNTFVGALAAQEVSGENVRVLIDGRAAVVLGLTLVLGSFWLRMLGRKR